MPPLIIPTAEPFFFPGGKTACLLVHGFTGTPKEMRWMGEYLAQQGYTTLGIRLAGHATQPADMIRMRWQDWLASVEDGWNLLKGISDHIYVIGLSMGGVLSLTFAARFPVKGVIAMSTPYEIRADWRAHFLRQISFFQPYMKKNNPTQSSLQEAHRDWYDLEAVKEHVSYPKNPVRSLVELFNLLAEMRSALPEIKAPVLLMHSRDDNYVSPDNMPMIYDALKTEVKEMFWVEHSGHVITREPQREQVFRTAEDFIRRTSG